MTDSEPITALDLTTAPETATINEKTEEDPTMTIKDFAKYCIEHSDSVPDVQPITLEEAQSMMYNLDRSAQSVPADITAESFMAAWNDWLQHPDDLDLD